MRACWNCGAPPRCERCGSIERRKNSKGCAECHRRYARARYKAKPPRSENESLPANGRVKACLHCDAAFTPKPRTRQVYCTTRCQRAANYVRNRDRNRDQCDCGALKARGSPRCRQCTWDARNTSPTRTALSRAVDIALARDTPPAKREAARVVLDSVARAHRTSREQTRTGFGALIAEALADRIEGTR